MNRPPKNYIPVREERLLAFLQECFDRAGLDPDHGAVISRLLVNSDLRGVRSHGTRYAPGYCQAFREGSLNPHPDIRVLSETPAVAVIEGDGTLGYLPMVQAAEHAVRKAKEAGVGMALVRNIGHYGAAGHYTRICLEHGCVGFSSQGFRNDGNAGSRAPQPCIAYSGAPPICFAIPAGNEPDIVLDAVANLFAGYYGEEYQDLLTRIPGAFFKSIGFVAVSTLLGGALTGFTLPEAEAIQSRWPGSRMGGMVLAVDVASIMPEPDFRAEVDRYSRAIRETYAPMPGFDRALLPGAVEEETMALYRREGIHFGEPEQGAARKLNESLGVPLPWD